MDLVEQAEAIETRGDLVAFIERVGKIAGSDEVQRWENSTLSRYLGALSSWTEDMDGVPEPRRGGADAALVAADWDHALRGNYLRIASEPGRRNAPLSQVWDVGGR